MNISNRCAALVADAKILTLTELLVEISSHEFTTAEQINRLIRITIESTEAAKKEVLDDE